MQCDDIRKIMGEAAGDSIPESARAHLAGCEPCRSWRQEWFLMRDGFRQLAADPAQEPSIGFSTRVLRRLEENSLPAWSGDFFERAGRRVVWATLLVALTILLALVLPSSGPVRGPGESYYLLAQPSMASVGTDPFADVDLPYSTEPALTESGKDSK